MAKRKYVLAIKEINQNWVKLSFEDGEYITIPRQKLPEKIYIGQLIEISIKTTTLLTLLKNIEKLAKREKDVKGIE